MHKLTSSEALDWTLSVVIISLLRRMFSSRLRSYSVSFVGAIEVKNEEKYLVWSLETLDWDLEQSVKLYRENIKKND
jgi:hypothetical protein